jgi:predicted helicase
MAKAHATNHPRRRSPSATAAAAYADLIALCTADDEAAIFQQCPEADARTICETGRLGAENRAICCTRDAGADFIVAINGRVAQGLFDARRAACLPFYLLAPDDGVRRENITDAAMDRFRAHYNDPAISKWSIFDYVYALLHHPRYRAQFAAQLARDLPRIPFAPDFRAFQRAGQKLIELHGDLAQLEPWPLAVIEPGIGRRTRSLRLDESTSVGPIPAKAMAYRLGDRSALDWMIDRHCRANAGEPNDPERIVRLVGQAVRACVETTAIISALPQKFM